MGWDFLFEIFVVPASQGLGCILLTARDPPPWGSTGTYQAEFLMMYPEMLQDVPGGKLGEMEKWGEMRETGERGGGMG